MSVINQMLKDLDKRSSKQLEEQHQVSAPPVVKNTSNKGITLAIIVIALLTYFLWQTSAENKALKQSRISKHHSTPVTSTAQVKNTDIVTLQNPVESIKAAKHEPARQEPKQNTLSQSSASNSLIKTTEAKLTPIQNNPNDNTIINQTAAETKVSFANTGKRHDGIADTKISAVNDKTAAEKKSPKEIDRSEQETSVSKKPTMSISRRTFSAEELAKQKLASANQAIATNNLVKAEALFEEILVLLPRHKDARQQLAALWFGRQAYQSAHNLLSQGIALMPLDSDFRVMKARIYLKQGNNQAALNTLLPLHDLPVVEYQLLLATTAQQHKQYPQAITAYRQLLSIHKNKGSWWLGLGIALDSNGDFSEAISAYKNAISWQDLSSNARQFAQQRIIELGE